jgi:hypothetical protein
MLRWTSLFLTVVMLSQYECTNCDSTEFPDVSILIKHVYYI